MSDENERSVASAGSVAGEPDAWMHVSGGLSLGVFKHVDPRLRHLCVPLYRHSQPMLTDAERDAIWAVAEAYAENDDDPECERIASVMHGLWQRTK